MQSYAIFFLLLFKSMTKNAKVCESTSESLRIFFKNTLKVLLMYGESTVRVLAKYWEDTWNVLEKYHEYTIVVLESKGPIHRAYHKSTRLNAVVKEG